MYYTHQDLRFYHNFQWRRVLVELSAVPPLKIDRDTPSWHRFLKIRHLNYKI